MLPCTRALTPRTKVLLFVSPDNPSGAIYSPAEVEAIGRWAVEKGVWVLTDEIYEHLVYGDNQFVSMPTVVPELANQCIIVNGVAKTYAMTGWRIGYTIANPEWTKAMVKLQSHSATHPTSFVQYACAKALQDVDATMDAVNHTRRTP